MTTITLQIVHICSFMLPDRQLSQSAGSIQDLVTIPVSYLGADGDEVRTCVYNRYRTMEETEYIQRWKESFEIKSVTERKVRKVLLCDTKQKK